MQIRTYEPRDEQGVIRLWRSVFAYDTPHNDPATVIEKKLAYNRELFFVGIEGDAIVGTVMGGYDGHRGWIYLLAVDPMNQRKGFGATLMRHLEVALEALGCPKINLQIHGHNEAVVAFYEKLGYQVEDRVNMGRIL